MYDISKSDYHRETIEKALGCASMVYYSANGELDEVAVRGKVILQSIPHLDGHESYTSAMIENPTWLDVSLCADAMIRVTGDEHQTSHFSGKCICYWRNYTRCWCIYSGNGFLNKRKIQWMIHLK